MKPKAAPARFPYLEHRTVEQADRDEREGRDARFDAYLRKDASARRRAGA